MTECELPTFYDYSEPIARKRHRCCECNAPILKGEKHFRGTGKWDGHIQTHRQHLLCMETCMLIRDEFNGFECIAFGDLKEWWDEYRTNIKYARRDIARNGLRPGWLDKEELKKLRSMMARIFWREHKANH